MMWSLLVAAATVGASLLHQDDTKHGRSAASSAVSSLSRENRLFLSGAGASVVPMREKMIFFVAYSSSLIVFQCFGLNQF
jgi:hypothetical protein